MMQAQHDGATWQRDAQGTITWWDGTIWRLWDGNPAGAQPPPHFTGRPVYVQAFPRPAATAHGPIYWLFVGWWWGPIKFAGRVLLWLVFWPLGLWRSIRHHQDTQIDRTNRGYRQG